MGAYILDEKTGSILVPCRLCGKRVTFKVDVEGFRKWQAGELIQRALPTLLKSQREILMSNTCDTCWDKYIKIDEDEEDILDISTAMREECLYHPTILDPNISLDEEVPNRCYLDAMRNYSVGDVVRHTVSAPGIGFREYLITRMDESGIYAVLLRSTVRILEPWECV